MSKKEGDKKDEVEEGIVKGISLTPVVTALFKPSAEYLGKELRNLVREGVEQVKSRWRERNLQSHMEAIRKRIAAEESKLDPEEEPFFRHADLFADCMESIQDVDPLDEELSELWHSLLTAAALGNSVSREALKALQRITPDEAVVLLQGHRYPLPVEILRYLAAASSLVSHDDYLRRSLAVKGLLERNLRFWPAYVFLGAFCIFLMTLPWSLPFTKEIGSLNALADLKGPIVFGTLIYCGLLMMATGFGQLKKSWLGREVTKYAKTNSS